MVVQNAIRSKKLTNIQMTFLLCIQPRGKSKGVAIKISSWFAGTVVGVCCLILSQSR